MINTTEATFQKDVIEASKDKLVMVDFWAPWCGPCRMIAPILEEIAADPKYDGKLSIVKLNTDEEGGLAQKYEITGIPNMKLFKNGVVVDDITGALPKPNITAVIDKHLGN